MSEKAESKGRIAGDGEARLTNVHQLWLVFSDLAGWRRDFILQHASRAIQLAADVRPRGTEG